ncbi:unnamed protein product [Aphanomyces euteiches]
MAEDILATALLDFLEVATHEFLYHWRIYPQGTCTLLLFKAHYASVGLFDKWKKYDVPVHICRHPKLVEYIRSMLQSCRPWIVQGRVDKLSIAVRSTTTGALLDTCVFELRLTTFSGKEMPKLQVEEAFRRSLVQLSAAALSRDGRSMDDERTFRLFLHTLEDSDMHETLVSDDSIENSWILAPREELSVSQAGVVPVASISETALPIQLNMYLVSPHVVSASSTSLS